MSQDFHALQDLYQQIGQLAVNHTPQMQEGKLLIYCEVEEGVVSSALFYERDADKVLTYMICPKEIDDVFEQVWQVWPQKEKSWLGFSYVLDGEHFKMDVTYPDQIVASEQMPDRCPSVVQLYFGAAEVDYVYHL